MLELEVVHLEHYLLSLYRKAFEQQISTVSPISKDKRLKLPLDTPRGSFLETSRLDTPSKKENSATLSGYQSLKNPMKESSVTGREEKQLDSSVHCCHSSLSQYSSSFITTPLEDSMARAVRACHSQPLSMMEVNKFSVSDPLFFVLLCTVSFVTVISIFRTALKHDEFYNCLP